MTPTKMSTWKDIWKRLVINADAYWWWAVDKTNTLLSEAAFMSSLLHASPRHHQPDCSGHFPEHVRLFFVCERQTPESVRTQFFRHHLSETVKVTCSNWAAASRSRPTAALSLLNQLLLPLSWTRCCVDQQRHLLWVPVGPTTECCCLLIQM